MHLERLHLLGVIMATMAFTSCAGGFLGKPASTNSLPKELSPEFQDKFEVREAELLASPEPSPVTPAVMKKNAVKVKSTAKPLPALASKDPGKASVKPTSVETKAPFQFISRRPKKDPIWLAEKHIFDITYFGMSAGEVALEVLPFKNINSRKVYHVKGHAQSSKVFSLFYKLDDTIESYLDFDGLFSHRFELKLKESKQTRTSLELYDSEKAQTYYWNRWNHHKKGYTEVKDFFPMPPFAQDSLSALFFIRTQPLRTGDVFSFPVVSEGKNWEAVITVVKRETINGPDGRIKAIVVKPETKYQGILKKQGDSFVWLSDDDRRMVLKLEAKVKIGTVIASLKRFDPGTRPAQ